MINRHQNSSLQALPKYNGKSACICDQKCRFATNKGVMTIKCTRDVIINAKTFNYDQEHLKHIELIYMTFDNQGDT